MDRRDAVKSIAILIGGTLSATTIATLFDGCTQPGKDGANLFNSLHEQLVIEISDIIIPTTTMSPGAKAAGVGSFITMMIKDCYPEEAQQAFVKGLDAVEASAKQDFGKSFMEIAVAEREQIIAKVREKTLLDQKEEKEKNDALPKSEKEKAANPMDVKEKPKTTPQFFAIIRDLSILGFFTSEIGATQAYEYIAIPGRYDGCADLKPGQRVWA